MIPGDGWTAFRRALPRGNRFARCGAEMSIPLGGSERERDRAVAAVYVAAALRSAQRPSGCAVERADS